MQVLILGGGRVGTTIAGILCDHRHDVTVIESDPVRARFVDDLLDARVVPGNASHHDVLFQADVGSADICLAVTGNDEVNLVGASVAKLMGAKRTVTHVNAPSIRDNNTVDYLEHFGIDRFLSVETLTAAEFAREIRATGDLMIDHFAGGEVELQEILFFNEPPPAMKKPLCELHFPADVRVGVIRRGNETKIATAQDVIQAGDRISLIGVRDAIESMKKRLQGESAIPKKILIGGGGEIGFHLAQILRARRHHVTILEVEQKRCEFLANHLLGCTVLLGDATSRSVLQNEQIRNFDCFVACTGADEENIISALEAKEFNPELRTLVLINRPDYAMISDKLKIDKAIIPAQVIASQVMGLLHTTPVLFRNTKFFNNAVDVVELEVRENAPLTRDLLRNVKLPKASLLAAVIRNGFVQVPNANFRFLPGDHVVALVQPEALPELITAL